MSAKYTFLAWDTPVKDASTKLALLQLANNADDNGFSYYSISKMAKACDMSDRNFMRKIQKLEELNVLRVERRSNRPSLYTLIGDEMGVTICHLQQSEVTICHAEVTICHAEGDKLSHVPNNTPKTNPNNKDIKPKFCPVHFASSIYQGYEINLESWTEWCEFRKSDKKTIIETTASKQLAMLVGYSIDEQKEIIDKSIMCQYQGLFPLKNKNQPRYASNQTNSFDLDSDDFMNEQSFSEKYGVQK